MGSKWHCYSTAFSTAILLILGWFWAPSLVDVDLAIAIAVSLVDHYIILELLIVDVLTKLLSNASEVAEGDLVGVVVIEEGNVGFAHHRPTHMTLWGCLEHKHTQSEHSNMNEKEEDEDEDEDEDENEDEYENEDEDEDKYEEKK